MPARIPSPPPLPLPAMGCHVLLVTGLSGNGMDPCVDKIASSLLRLHDEVDADCDDDDDSDDLDVWKNHGGGFATRRSSFDRSAGLSPSPSPPRPKKLLKSRYGTAAGQESVGDDGDDSIVESDYDSAEDEAIVRRLAERGHHPSSFLAAAAMPLTVHVVETLSELDDIGVEMDHVVLIHRDLDTVVPVAAAVPSPPAGGASTRMADRRDANGTAATTAGTTNAWLSAEDKHALRRNMLVKDWQRRVSRVRIVNQPFAAAQPNNLHIGNHADTNNNQNDDECEIPTFVCHEYDPNSIQQVAQILRKIARTRPMPRTTRTCPAAVGAPA